MGLEILSAFFAPGAAEASSTPSETSRSLQKPCSGSSTPRSPQKLPGASQSLQAPPGVSSSSRSFQELCRRSPALAPGATGSRGASRSQTEASSSPKSFQQPPGPSRGLQKTQSPLEPRGGLRSPRSVQEQPPGAPRSPALESPGASQKLRAVARSPPGASRSFQQPPGAQSPDFQLRD